MTALRLYQPLFVCLPFQPNKQHYQNNSHTSCGFPNLYSGHPPAERVGGRRIVNKKVIYLLYNVINM
uniref:Ovule protein n=1 Tax=Heterorhabditis bacteriophora TaxID=37862 RepID=A0A1I7WTB0_HETBA